MLAGTFAAVTIALLATHLMADYVVQDDRLAVAKTLRGWSGRGWCTLHVATHVILALGIMWALQTLCITAIPDGPQPYAAITLIAVTHYLVDRREPLVRLARLLGKREWAASVGGLATFDQAVHALVIVVAALLITTAS